MSSLLRRKATRTKLAMYVGGIAILALAILLQLYGTLSIEEVVNSTTVQYLVGVVLIVIIARQVWESTFPRYSIEYDYNNEVDMGRKRGEFNFSLEGKTFYGVDCGGVKIILLQGTVAPHEKRLLSPQKKGGRVFTIQRLAGRKLKRLVLRGVPINDPNMIIRLGFLGRDDVLGNQNIVNNLQRMLTSADWSSVVWLAPHLPDELYKQFLFQERSFSEIETTYEGRLDNLIVEFNDRVIELKNHYMSVSMNIFYGMLKSIRTVIGSSDQAMLIVNYLLGKRPKEVEDALTALHLEGGTERLRRAMTDKVQDLEDAKDLSKRLTALFAETPKGASGFGRLGEKVAAMVKKPKAHPETPEASA